MERVAVWSVLLIMLVLTVIIFAFGPILYYKAKIYILQSRIDQINEVIVHAKRLTHIYHMKENYEVADKYDDYIDLCYRRLRVKESQIRYYNRMLEKL